MDQITNPFEVRKPCSRELGFFTISVLDCTCVMYPFYIILHCRRSVWMNRSGWHDKNPQLAFLPRPKYHRCIGSSLAKQDPSPDSLLLKFVLGRRVRKASLVKTTSTIFVFLVLWDAPWVCHPVQPHLAVRTQLHALQAHHHVLSADATRVMPLAAALQLLLPAAAQLHVSKLLGGTQTTSPDLSLLRVWLTLPPVSGARTLMLAIKLIYHQSKKNKPRKNRPEQTELDPFFSPF